MERSADWLKQALGDLAHARNDIEARFYDWACFSAQQAAEKAVKAVFQKLGAEAWGHAVVDLLAALPANLSVPGEISDAAQEVDKAYILARYPDALPAGAPTDRFTRTEAERMVEDAERIVAFCQGLLATL